MAVVPSERTNPLPVLATTVDSSVSTPESSGRATISVTDWPVGGRPSWDTVTVLEELAALNWMSALRMAVVVLASYSKE